MKSNNLFIMNKRNVEYIIFPRLKKCGAVNHLFTTRLGGVSKGKYSSMNMSFTIGDNLRNVLENYRIACACEGINPEHLVLSKQTHTNHVVTVTKSDIGRGITKPEYCDVDGLVTNIPGIALVTQYADCTPLLFCDPIKKVIATSHSGWRGTVKQIGAITVKKMRDEFGCNPKNIIAAIGPCIGSCCYEVDDPVFNAFCEIHYLNLPAILKKKENGKYMLNLTEANRQILLHAGIDAQNMDISDICTCCNHEEMHSHRATHGERGTLAAIIELKK